MPKATPPRDYYERVRRANDKLYKLGYWFHMNVEAGDSCVCMTMPVVSTRPDCPLQGDGSWGVAVTVSVATGEHLVYPYKRNARTDERKFRRPPEPLLEPIHLRITDSQGYVALADAIAREAQFFAGVHETTGL
jgi:hypothetical protein